MEAAEIKSLPIQGFSNLKVMGNPQAMGRKERMMLKMMKDAVLHNLHLEKRVSPIENPNFLKTGSEHPVSTMLTFKNSTFNFCNSRNKAIITTISIYKKTISEFIWMECSLPVLYLDRISLRYKTSTLRLIFSITFHNNNRTNTLLEILLNSQNLNPMTMHLPTIAQ